MKQILRNTINLSMTHVDQVASFLCEFIFKTKAFRCYLGGYYKDGNTITYITQSGDVQPCYIEWSKDSVGDFLGGYHGGYSVLSITATHHVTVEMLSA